LFQCAIPVFDGLLPEPHNTAVLQLLFVAAHWHVLAKLRLHNDYTLDILELVTGSFGELLCGFSNETCPAFPTRELQKEYNARMHHNANSPTPAKPTHQKAKTNKVTVTPSPAIIVSDQQPSVTLARSTDLPLPDGANLTEHGPLPSSSSLAVPSSPPCATQTVANT
jgi:hypothetical protein